MKPKDCPGGNDRPFDCEMKGAGWLEIVSMGFDGRRDLVNFLAYYFPH